MKLASGMSMKANRATSVEKFAGQFTTWTDDGPLSLFKQDGDQRGAFEFRTGLIPMLGSATGKIYAARLPPNLTSHLIEQEWSAVFRGKPDAARFRDDAVRELKRKGYSRCAARDCRETYHSNS